MFSHPSTGQVGRAVRAASLPIICLVLTSTSLLAQADRHQGHVPTPENQSQVGQPTQDASTNPATDPATASPASQGQEDPRGAANPAPEPDTWMLLGTGAVVLLLLYAKRRVQVLAPEQSAS